MKKSQLICALLVCALMATQAACSSSNTSSSAPETTKEETTSIEETTKIEETTTVEETTTIEETTTEEETTVAATTADIVASTYEDVTTMTKDRLMSRFDSYYYDGIELLSDDVKWLNDPINKKGTVNQGFMYRKIAMLLEGYYIGARNQEYAKQIVGYEVDSYEDFEPIVERLQEFIVTEDALNAVMRKFESLDCVDGDFDFDKGSVGAYHFQVNDIESCVSELGVSDKCLAYIFAFLEEYGGKTTFDGNTCSVNLEW